jgi:nuclear control of ATPase protein 2
MFRRIERLVHTESEKEDISSLIDGFLLLSVAYLRSYGETYLPKNSRLQEGFLYDVDDLGNPDKSRKEKAAVVERMWRSWGHVLGWYTVAAENLFS